MKETRTINLNGIVFHIDNDAYQALSNYFNDIELRLPADERIDVMTDVEARVCELLQSALFAKNVQVIDISMINAIKAQIGSPADFGENKRPVIRHASKANNSGCGRILKITLYVLLAIIAAQILLPVLGVIFVLCMAGLGVGIGLFTSIPFIYEPFYGSHWGMGVLAVLSAVVALGLPIVAIIYTIVCWMRARKGPRASFWWIAIICWLLSVGCFTAAIVKQTDAIGGVNGIIQQIQMVDDDPTLNEDDPDFFESDESEDDVAPASPKK